MALRLLEHLHLNPAAWDVIRSVTKQFDVEVIVDAGDGPCGLLVDSVASVVEVVLEGAPVWEAGQRIAAG